MVSEVSYPNCSVWDKAALSLSPIPYVLHRLAIPPMLRTVITSYSILSSVLTSTLQNHSRHHLNAPSPDITSSATPLTFYNFHIPFTLCYNNLVSSQGSKVTILSYPWKEENCARKGWNSVPNLPSAAIVSLHVTACSTTSWCFPHFPSVARHTVWCSLFLYQL